MAPAIRASSDLHLNRDIDEALPEEDGLEDDNDDDNATDVLVVQTWIGS
jgi:hypothetical protein